MNEDKIHASKTNKIFKIFIHFIGIPWILDPLIFYLKMQKTLQFFFCFMREFRG